ncbi:MAG: hypothetical protein QM776_09335 [Rhodocyclaceae bacterium]
MKTIARTAFGSLALLYLLLEATALVRGHAPYLELLPLSLAPIALLALALEVPHRNVWHVLGACVVVVVFAAANAMAYVQITTPSAYAEIVSLRVYGVSYQVLFWLKYMLATLGLVSSFLFHVSRLGRKQPCLDAGPA